MPESRSFRVGWPKSLVQSFNQLFHGHLSIQLHHLDKTAFLVKKFHKYSLLILLVIYINFVNSPYKYNYNYDYNRYLLNILADQMKQEEIPNLKWDGR